jgi:hypothetical protein
MFVRVVGRKIGKAKSGGEKYVMTKFIFALYDFFFAQQPSLGLDSLIF